MAEHSFEYLPLLVRYQGRAKLKGGGKTSPQTVANRNARGAHSASLAGSVRVLGENWKARSEQRELEGAPTIPRGVPFLIKVDPSLDLDVLRDKFAFEIVSEQEEGFVLVASEDIELSAFSEMVQGFATKIHGSATIASVHRLFDGEDQSDRLGRILSEHLLQVWPHLDPASDYIVDVGIACVGTAEIPTPPNKLKRDSDEAWAQKEAAWANARVEAYDAWDKTKMDRESDIERLVYAYGGNLLHIIDGDISEGSVLPDSFTVRIRIVGKGLRDLVLNYPYIFEVLEPEDIALPQKARGFTSGDDVPTVSPVPPDPLAPTVCVIDSGIQEGHVLLQPAIDASNSHCFVPGESTDAVGDFVRPAGHGTRVAGAVLYGEIVPKDGSPELPLWIQNARVLDESNCMPVDLFPPLAMRTVVSRYHQGARKTRIFNHSINASAPCRMRHMSAWAAEIDALSAEMDVLVVQTTGNIPIQGVAPQIGVQDHLVAGRRYPVYLYEASSRVANPAQSLQALTVGSVGYGLKEKDEWRTFATQEGHPSAFSRAGFGIWNVIKPEVVEYGGDDVCNAASPPDVQEGGVVSEACPELVRSTMFPPGPAFDRDETGTSFAAPKVARIAAMLQQVLPTEPTLLYRALIVQSARWPEWAESILAELRNPQLTIPAREGLSARALRVLRCIGYGIPDQVRATTNTDYRTTFVTAGGREIRALECHIYQVPIPLELRRPGDEFDIRIEVTLSYVARPRRTRRNLRRYLSTWVDWKSSKLGEGLDDFRSRALKEDEGDNLGDSAPGSVLPWVLHESAKAGAIRDVRRNSGTVQKDWAVVKSNALPEQFCIAVVGHQGWSHDPDSTATYTLAATFEILNQEVPIYDPLRAAVVDLQVEARAEAEVEVLR